MFTTSRPNACPPIEQSDREAFEAELARCVAGEGECKRNWDALDHDAGAWLGVCDWLMEWALIWKDGHA